MSIPIISVIIALVGGLMFDWLQAHMPWSLFALLLIIAVWLVWFVKGNIVFCPWKWSKYTTVEVLEITPTEEQMKYVLGAPEPEPKGRILDIKGEYVKRKIKKGR